MAQRSEDQSAEQDIIDSWKAHALQNSTYGMAAHALWLVRLVAVLTVLCQLGMTWLVAMLHAEKVEQLALNNVRCSEGSAQCVPVVPQPHVRWQTDLQNTNASQTHMQYILAMIDPFSPGGATYSSVAIGRDSYWPYVCFLTYLSVHTWTDTCTSMIFGFAGRDLLQRVFGLLLALLRAHQLSAAASIYDGLERSGNAFDALIGMLSLLFISDLDERLFQMHLSTDFLAQRLKSGNVWSYIARPFEPNSWHRLPG